MLRKILTLPRSVTSYSVLLGAIPPIAPAGDYGETVGDEQDPQNSAGAPETVLKLH